MTSLGWITLSSSQIIKSSPGTENLVEESREQIQRRMKNIWPSLGRFPFQEVSAVQILDTKIAMTEKKNAYGLCSVLIQQS